MAPRPLTHRARTAARPGLTFKSQVRRPGIGFHPALLVAAGHAGVHAATALPLVRGKPSARALGAAAQPQQAPPPPPGDSSCGPGIG